MIRLAALVLVFTLPLQASGQGLHLSPFQQQMEIYAYRVGGLRLAAIILNESSGCTQLHGIDSHAHGCGQMHTKTLWHVAQFKMSPWWLDHDYEMSIRAENLYLQECTRDFGWRGGISCYHMGLPAASHMTYYQLNHSPYLATIERRMRELQALPLSEN